MTLANSHHDGIDQSLLYCLEDTADTALTTQQIAYDQGLLLGETEQRLQALRTSGHVQLLGPPGPFGFWRLSV